MALASRANCCKPGPQTFASAKPKNATVTASSLQLDGTGSKSGDGKPLSYSWTIAPGSLSAPIFGSNTATPTVLFGVTHGNYTFQLTVTDSKGTSATDFATGQLHRKLDSDVRKRAGHPAAGR